MSDPGKPVVLATVANEPLASMMVARLQMEEIEAEMSGVLASDFRTEAPGGVQVLVRAQDAPRARELLAQWHAGNAGETDTAGDEDDADEPPTDR